MQIILKKDLLSNSEEIINILYGENDIYIENWINTFFNQEIDALKMIPYEKNIIPDTLDYFVEIKDNVYYLIKKWSECSKGYIYNSYEKFERALLSIKCLQYDNIDPLFGKIQSQPFWNGINSEITHRVMRQLDKESLLQLMLKLENGIKSRDTWTSSELIMLQNEMTKSHKKLLYSNIVKKTKKFNKKSIPQPKPMVYHKESIHLPCKTIISEGDSIQGISKQYPDLSRYATSCTLEYHLINKEKFE